jgi:hypothetical protein
MEIEVFYSTNGVNGFEKFNNKEKAFALFKEKVNDKNTRSVSMYNASSGFHSTAQIDRVIAFYGEGSYLDNVSKRDSNLASKKFINK